MAQRDILTRFSRKFQTGAGQELHSLAIQATLLWHCNKQPAVQLINYLRFQCHLISSTIFEETDI